MSESYAVLPPPEGVTEIEIEWVDGTDLLLAWPDRIGLELAYSTELFKRLRKKDEQPKSRSGKSLRNKTKG